MKNTLFITAAAGASLVSRAWAHPGHGMPTEVHWHATDLAGLAMVAIGAVLALWLARDE